VNGQPPALPEEWPLPEWAELDRGARPTACRSCGATILWVLSKRSGKRAPLNPDGTSHFATCPQADQWRRK
jgi:hypothetical protein